MSVVQTAGGSSASQDRLIYYASVFVYNPKLKQDFINFNPTIQSYEGKFIASMLSFIVFMHIFNSWVYSFPNAPQWFKRQIPRIHEHDRRAATSNHQRRISHPNHSL